MTGIKSFFLVITDQEFVDIAKFLRGKFKGSTKGSDALRPEVKLEAFRG